MSSATRRHNESVLSRLEKGDMVKYKRGLYDHYAVYIGDGDVVHLGRNDANGGLNNSTSARSFSVSGTQNDKAWVKRETFWQVVGDSETEKANKDETRTPLPKHTIVENALSKIGRVGYNIIFSNCEHFANWCRYGIEMSEQVDGVVTSGAIGLAVAGVLV